jgi:hypothetical protein
MIVGDIDDRSEVIVVLSAHSNVAWIDSVLVQGFRARRIFPQENVSVVVKISDDGRIDPAISKLSHDVGNGCCRFTGIHRDSDQL